MKIDNLTQEEITSMWPVGHVPLLVGWRGSVAHGLYIPNSDPNSIDDKDLMGVTVGPLSNYFGMHYSEGKDTWVGSYDVVSYDVKKFIRLCVKANPNVISLLWLREEDYLHIHKNGRKIITMRDEFMTKHIYHSFVGYANGQLKRMTHYSFDGYMGDKRKKLVEKYGYDTKNAAHLIRLLRMGIEALETGKFQVYRTKDRDELLDIKNGKWPLEDVITLSDELFMEAKVAVLKTDLPFHPNEERINKKLVDIIEDCFNS